MLTIDGTNLVLADDRAPPFRRRLGGLGAAPVSIPYLKSNSTWPGIVGTGPWTSLQEFLDWLNASPANYQALVALGPSNTAAFVTDNEANYARNTASAAASSAAIEALGPGGA